ncbi:MAG TPA: glycosyltransferase [Acidiferrobacter sp.]|nr:glycosyltransferase [Acidiferrobacter sp.]
MGKTPDAGTPRRLVVSVVSHGQAALIAHLWADLAAFCKTPIHVVLTVNKPESLEGLSLPFPLTIIRNLAPRGFGANHNAAAAAVDSDIFCVLNPDVRLRADPFPALMCALEDDEVGVVAPLVTGSGGEQQDSARAFPTPGVALGRLLRKTPPRPTEPVEWVAGMCMVFRTPVFNGAGGFDDRYWLYYEDADLCCRLTLAGFRVLVCADAVIIHDAQRTSHRNLRYLVWHIRSALRFFRSSSYRLWRAGSRCEH